MPVYLYDMVKTGAESRLRIKFKNGSILALGQKGNLNLDEFECNPQKKKRSDFFRMAIGKLRVFANDLKKFKGKSFEIKTPTAVCGVRCQGYPVFGLGQVRQICQDSLF